MNVLIVEGDTVFGRFVKGLVEGWGHAAELCNRGRNALERLRNGVFDLVLLDILLPEEKGDRLIRQIKELRPEALIVAMTDRNSYEMEVRIRGMGILYYLIKSLEIESLGPLLDHIGGRSGTLRTEAAPKWLLSGNRNPRCHTRNKSPLREEVLEMHTSPGEIQALPTEMETVSICSTCEHRADCMLRRRNRSPVYFCEEYQPAGPKWDAADRGGFTALSGSGRFGSSYLGLCRTCKKLATCPLVRPGGGTWHCPDYEENKSSYS